MTQAKRLAERRPYRLPIDIIHAGRLVAAGEELALLPDQIERVEACARVKTADESRED